MGDAVGLLVVEVGDVVAQELGVEAAADVDDAALLDRDLDRVGDEPLERRDDDVAAVDDDLAVDAVVGAAGEEEARGPVIPAARRVGVAVLRHDGVVAELVGHIGAGGVREAERLGRGQELLAGLDAPALVEGREEAGEVVDRLDAEQHAGAGLLDLDLLRENSRNIRSITRSACLSASIAGRLSPSGVTPTVHAPASPMSVEEPRAGGRGTAWRRAPGGRHEGVGVVLALVHLREDGDALALTQSAELELLGAQLDERERHGHGRFLALVR